MGHGSPSILVVDDESEILRATHRHLRRRSCEFAVAESLEAARQLLAVARYDAVIADHRMDCTPGGGGLTLLRYAQQAFPQMRRFLMSAVEPPELALELKRGTVERFFPKPILWDELLEVLGAIQHEG